MTKISTLLLSLLFLTASCKSQNKTTSKMDYQDNRPREETCNCFKNAMTDSPNFLATAITVPAENKLTLHCASIVFYSMIDEKGMEYETQKNECTSTNTITRKLAKDVKFMMHNTNNEIIENNDIGKKLFYERLKNPLNYYQIKINKQGEIYEVFEDLNMY